MFWFVSISNLNPCAKPSLRDLDPGPQERTIASGYMRNFLFPKGIAVYATPDNVEKYKTVFTEVRPIGRLSPHTRRKVSYMHLFMHPFIHSPPSSFILAIICCSRAFHDFVAAGAANVYQE